MLNLKLEVVLRFVVVAEQLSFKRAAAVLGVDQPWLSQQIMKLESEMGVHLLDRSGHTIQLTPEGREFLNAAQQFSEAAQKIKFAAKDISQQKQTAIRIGACYPTLHSKGREALLNKYKEVRPNVNIDLTVLNDSQSLSKSLREGMLDFGIVFGPLQDIDLEERTLEQVQPHLVIPAEDPLAAQPTVRLAELAGSTIGIGRRDQGSARYEHLYAWIDDVGATAHLVPEGRRFLAQEAQRHRLKYISYISEDLIPPDFVRRPLAKPHPQVEICLVRHQRIMSSSCERLWRLAREIGLQAS